MSEKNRAKEYYINNRDNILNRAKEYYINNKESIREDPKIKDYQKEYRKTMTDEQKQRYKEAKNKRDKDKYRNMTDEEREKKKEYQKEYRKNMSDAQKQRFKENRNKRNKGISDKKESNYEKIIITIIKDNDVIKL